MREVSDRTLGQLLQKRMERVGAFQIFVRVLGPNDVTYASAQAVAQDGRIVEAKASAMDPAAALLQLFANLDQATDHTNETEET